MIGSHCFVAEIHHMIHILLCFYCSSVVQEAVDDAESQNDTTSPLISIWLCLIGHCINKTRRVQVEKQLDDVGSSCTSRGIITYNGKQHPFIYLVPN